ncbi:MAG: helix-turn-helix transcriptional regulator [Rubrobacteraceae bacterium]
MLTLSRPGGVGKTRLGTRVASELADDFADGTCFVSLASVAESGLVIPTAARALGLREIGERSLRDRLGEYLRDRRLLLFLDNFEQVAEAASEVAELLVACPNLKVLATSREALRLAGERVYPVPPLALPDVGGPLEGADALSRYESVALFVARAAEHDFRLTDENAADVAGICARLDGLPLAIELAAARARILSPRALLARLGLELLTGGTRDLPMRQRTLRDAIQWSHDLLDEGERRLFRRLSAFVGGFTLHAAETVCDEAGSSPMEVLNGMESLAGKSLLRRVGEDDGEPRYSMLETIREYALEQLSGSGEGASVRRVHADYYLKLAERAEPELTGPRKPAWLSRLETEYGNLRAALSWFLGREDAGQVESGLRLATALGPFWDTCSLSEGRRWLEEGLAGSGVSAGVRAKALDGAAWISLFQGDPGKAKALLEEALALFEGLEDESGSALALFHLGFAMMELGDMEHVAALCGKAEELRRGAIEPRMGAHLILYLGMAALMRRERERAVALIEESLVAFRGVEDLQGAAMCLTILGVAALASGDHERAAELLREDLRLLRKLRDKVGISQGLLGMAGVYGLRGEPIRAARLWGAEEALRENSALSIPSSFRAYYDYAGRVAASRGGTDEEGFAAAWSEGRAMTPDQAIEYALETPGAVSPPYPAGLTAREVEVLRLVAEGQTSARVAAKLFISTRTVSAHLTSIYKKLGLRSRAAATRFAVDNDLV